MKSYGCSVPRNQISRKALNLLSLLDRRYAERHGCASQDLAVYHWTWNNGSGMESYVPTRHLRMHVHASSSVDLACAVCSPGGMTALMNSASPLCGGGALVPVCVSSSVSTRTGYEPQAV